MRLERRRRRRPPAGSVVIDDHLLRHVLAGERPANLGLAAERIATTGMRLPAVLLRACSGNCRLQSNLSPDLRAAFRARLTALPEETEVIAMRQLAWPMAGLQRRHRARGHNLSAAMVEALAAAHQLQASIAVSMNHERCRATPPSRRCGRRNRIGFHVI